MTTEHYFFNFLFYLLTRRATPALMALSAAAATFRAAAAALLFNLVVLRLLLLFDQSFQFEILFASTIPPQPLRRVLVVEVEVAGRALRHKQEHFVERRFEQLKIGILSIC
jgi:hypothetical protein